MGTLHFDEDSHTYTMDGVRVDNVTSILGQLSANEYRFVTQEVMENAAELGRAVHKMIELDLRDDLDTDSLTPELALYFRAWHNFLNTSGFQVILSEFRVYSARYGYAGTLDIAGDLNGKFCVIDAKRTAQVPRTAGPQTAAYKQALAEYDGQGIAADLPKDADRYALHLRKDGTYRLVPFTDKADLRVFLACKTLNNWSNAA